MNKQAYTGEDKLAQEVGQLLLQKQYTVACAESCTGGLVSSRLTDISGSSQYVMGGVVAYTNEVKISHLGVAPETLAAYGAVSPETAGEMSAGIRRAIHTDLGIGITGIAGPGGGSAKKPVGLVYLSLTTPTGTITQGCNFQGTRTEIKWQSSEKALTMLKEYLQTVI